MFEGRMIILEMGKRPLEPPAPCWRLATLRSPPTSQTSQHPLDLPTTRRGWARATAVIVTVFLLPRSLVHREGSSVTQSSAWRSLSTLSSTRRSLKAQTCTRPPDLLTPAAYSWSKVVNLKNFLAGRSRTSFLQCTRNGPGFLKEKKWNVSRGLFTMLSSPRKLWNKYNKIKTKTKISNQV